MESTVYKMMINNLSNYLRNIENPLDNDNITVFDMSSVLAIALCKSKEEIAIDIALNQIKDDA